MTFDLEFSEEADETLTALEADASQQKIYKAVGKTLKLMQSNLRHPSLNTHEIRSFRGPRGSKVYEAYVQNNAPSAWRILWCYGPEQGQLTILAIIPHL